FSWASLILYLIQNYACLTTHCGSTFGISPHLGAIARSFPYITPKSALARLASCQKPWLTKFLTIRLILAMILRSHRTP
ncbi:MAG: hypothetical protein ACKO90_42835, partial [Microcystis panniformis]